MKPHQLHIAGAGGKASAWSKWLQPLLSQAIQAAPLEFSSLWACCVRFAVHSLTTERCSEALGALLDSISAPIPQGELFYVVIWWLFPLFSGKTSVFPDECRDSVLYRISLYYGPSSSKDSDTEDNKLVREDEPRAKVGAPVFGSAEVQACGEGFHLCGPCVRS